MGFFDNLKKSIYGDQKQNKYVKQGMDILQYQIILDNGEHFEIDRILRNEVIDHNGLKTQLCEAVAIQKEKEEDAFYFEGNQLRNILFEFPVGAYLGKEILDRIVKAYQEEVQNPDNDSRFFYIGYLDPNSDRRTKTVEGMEALDNRIREEEEKKARDLRNREKRKAEKEKEKARMSEKTSAFKNERDYLIKYRLDNPYLEQTIGGYNGINMNTGDILRLRYINKVGKDKEGTYLYVLRAESTWDESNVERLDEDSFGQFICFTTDRKIEDIYARKNAEEVENFLKLVSYNDEPKKELIYMGDFCNGRKTNKGINDLSSALKSTIEMKQREYKRQNEDIDI